ncbi:hypothetical protein KIN20_007403 [Parelaphostrongylus tenuis]|uniref:Uncharacterized protein n=1 Tax=Parelaphostrongylus tenuis TaxID=148309 RepID=A0AAD5M3D0_PARTN|nr:hypothetical protein KIN20_007403 [Parelaphostrongylus tenuis]
MFEHLPVSLLNESEEMTSEKASQNVDGGCKRRASESNHFGLDIDEAPITNVVMANWSTAMLKNILNRALRMLALGPFGSHFFSASATVRGNLIRRECTLSPMKKWPNLIAGAN